MSEQPQPRPRRSRRRRRHGTGTGAMTPRSVASDSDPSSTGPVASLAVPDLQHPSSPSTPPAAPAAPPVAPTAPPRPPYTPQPARSVPDDGPSQTEINARNQVELHETTLKYIAMKRDSRPLNTQDAYGPRQKEWREWCLRKRFADGELVTEGKMVAFLDQEVVGRVVRTQPRKDPPPEERLRPVGLATFSLYTAAIVDLWKEQVSMGLNHHPNPRTNGKAWKEAHAALKRGQHQAKRDQYVDRGSGTLQDGYTRDQFVTCLEGLWRNGSESRQYVEPYLRTVCDLLLDHTMLLRGHSTRACQLADLFTLEFQNEGVTPCWPVIMVMDQGKTNQFGKREYAACIRNREVITCPVGALAFYLFYRWHRGGESFPDFTSRRDWYDIFLLKGKNNRQEITYDTQLDWVKRAFTSAGVAMTKKTHAGRGQGAREAETRGATEFDIRRAGRWNSDTMSNAYLSSFPRSAIKALAGFDINFQANYYLPRAKEEPPEKLACQVWPQIDGWLQQFTEGTNEPDLAGQGFLKLLKHLRGVLLQDSVLLRRQFPSHAIWGDPLFATSEYIEFAERVIVGLDNGEEPHLTQINKANPLVANELQTLGRTITSAEASIRLDIARQQQSSVTTLQELREQRQFVESLSRGLNRRLYVNDWSYERIQEAESRLETAGLALPAITSSDLGLQRTAALSEPLSGTVDPADPPCYEMVRTHGTVTDLWREWSVGWVGQPSIQSLDDSWGHRWRRGNEVSFYSRRRLIIKEIQRLVQ